MRFLFVAVGSAGDVLPLLSVAGELKRLGYRVTLASGYGYAEATRLLGVEYIALDSVDEHRRVLRDKYLLASRYGSVFVARHSLRWNQRVFEAIKHRASRDLVIVSSERPNLWADVVAHRFGLGNVVRMVVDLPSIQHLCSMIPAGKLIRGIDAKNQAGWAAYLRTQGTRSGWNHTGRVYRSVRSAIPTLALWPSWLVGPEDAPGVTRIFGFMPLPGLRSFSSDSPPSANLRVVFVSGTQGTTYNWADRFAVTAGKVCLELGIQGTLLGPQGRCPTPDGLTAKEFVPLHEALNDASLIVHHGGIGTAAAAMERGVPQIILPRTFAQPSNAEWIRRAGLCSVMRPSAWCVENAKSAIISVLRDKQIKRQALQASNMIDRLESRRSVCGFLENVYPSTSVDDTAR